jgi:hypothetical protein
MNLRMDSMQSEKEGEDEDQVKFLGLCNWKYLISI